MSVSLPYIHPLLHQPSTRNDVDPLTSRDLAFQIQQYHSLAPMYYKGAAAAIVVYDITRPESFNTLQRWIKELKDKGPEEIRICIAGNKRDLEDQRRVDTADAEVSEGLSH